jgi:hypothetical protein
MIKDSKIKSVLWASLFIVSASCFLYVNTAIEPASSAFNTKDAVEQAKHLKDTRTPDLKLVSGVVELIAKFITAK